jgi:hypothetical protein
MRNELSDHVFVRKPLFDHLARALRTMLQVMFDVGILLLFSILVWSA